MRYFGNERLSLVGCVKLLPILGSIRHQDKLLDVMKTRGVDTVYHAAAYKHVPMVERNIAEGVLNNVIDTLNTAQYRSGCVAVGCVQLCADLHR